MRESAGVMEHCKISNSKHQITNKYQIPIFNDPNRFGIWNFGHCDLFDIWDLGFGISPFGPWPLLLGPFPRQDQEEEDEEAEDEVLEGELEGHREIVDDDDSRNPDAPVGDQERDRGVGEPAAVELPASFAERVAAVFPEEADEQCGDTPEGDVDELVDEHLDDHGAGVGIVAEDPCLDPVEGVELESLERPEDEEEGEVTELRVVPGFLRDEAEEERQQTGEKSGGNRGEEETEAFLPSADGFERIMKRRPAVVADEHAERDDHDDHAGQRVGSGRLPAKAEGVGAGMLTGGHGGCWDGGWAGWSRVANPRS